MLLIRLSLNHIDLFPFCLQLLTLHFDRCAKYYGSTSMGASTDEEKRLTMMLFSNIFDSLSKMVCNQYDGLTDSYIRLGVCTDT